MKFLGCTWYETEFGKEKGNLEALSTKVNFTSQILARLVLRNNHLRKPHDMQSCTSKAAWDLAREYASSKPKITTFYSLVKAPERQRRSYVYCGFGSFQCTKLGKEN